MVLFEIWFESNKSVVFSKLSEVFSPELVFLCFYCIDAKNEIKIENKS